jgi:hypothetical protein
VRTCPAPLELFLLICPLNAAEFSTLSTNISSLSSILEPETFYQQETFMQQHEQQLWLQTWDNSSRTPMMASIYQMILLWVPAQQRVNGFGYSSVLNLKQKIQRIKRIAQLRKMS